MNEGVVWRLEHGSRQNTITVSVIVDLAHVLGVRPAELIEAPSVPSPGDLVEDDDVATVGSLLSDAGGWVDIDDLAIALGWTLDHAFLALDGLGQAVEVCGQRSGLVSRS